MVTRRQLQYLCAIAHLSPEGRPVRSADIADELGVSKVSVASMAKTLASEGLVSKERYGSISLAPSARALAEHAQHMTLAIETRLPSAGLKLPPQQAHALSFVIVCALLGCDDLCIFDVRECFLKTKRE